jgi:glycosyltransferase involved in cell wall biosynthesis
MSTTPLVSVIIPVFNAESTIIATLESVVRQTYTKIEIVVVDDGSRDNSNQRIREYIEANPDVNIKLIGKANGGVSSARNTGIDHATGDYICFLDSDDIWLPEKVMIQLEIFAAFPEIDCLGTTINDERYTKMFGISFDRLTRITPRMMLLKNFVHIMTTMTKRAAISDIGYFYTDQLTEDANLIIRLAHKFNTYLLNESLVVCGNGKPIFGHSGLSSRLWEMEKGELSNVRMAVDMKIIRPYEYPFYAGFSLAKYVRRVIITFFRNAKKNNS